MSNHSLNLKLQTSRASRGGRARASLYPKAWQQALMRYAAARRLGRTRCRTFAAWLKQQGLRGAVLNGHGR